ncbi:MAG: metabolite traffic protein EboE [Rhodobacter sp.]|nr:metabolite traffic protein EboE [Rhodobacter sp.]
MKLPGSLGHLTYCLNIHATQTWDEVLAALTGPVAAVKSAVSPDAPFAVGLRFSGEALDELADPDKRAHLKAVMDAQGYHGITVNGFPYGRFHGTRVKEEVYQPDWRSDERVRYTNALADLMAEIAPQGEVVSLSTVPGTFGPLAAGAEAEMAGNYLKSVAHLVDLRARTGVTVALAIEPEPFCFLKTIAETVGFFTDHLFSDAAAARIAEMTGLSVDEAAKALPRHLGLCYDVCHAAVEYEDPAGSIAALRRAGIPVHKLQLSAALRIPVVGAEQRAALVSFDEPTYLHQVIRRTESGLKVHVDLPEVLALGDATDGEEWRVHFHVPVFIDDLGAFSSTRNFLEEILDLHRENPISPHLEIETYTWDVLPDAVRGETVDKDILREMNWVLDRLGS